MVSFFYASVVSEDVGCFGVYAARFPRKGFAALSLFCQRRSSAQIFTQEGDMHICGTVVQFVLTSTRSRSFEEWLLNAAELTKNYNLNRELTDKF